MDCKPLPGRKAKVASSREYPERPVVGVGGVIIEIPGGTLEVGETLQEGVARELLEETGIEVRVLELIEVFDRIFPGENLQASGGNRPQFHFVIVDYLCERIRGEARAGSDVTDVAFATEDELPKFSLTETAARVLKRAFAMALERGSLR